MERSRESKRAASAPRRLRISCPKDPADADARMDDTPLIEKVKKGNLQAFLAPFPVTATAWTKRKRHGFQEAHNLSEGSNFVKDFAPSDEYEDDAVQGAVNSKQKAKKDELMMKICNIPRRARSSTTRVPFASSRPPYPSPQQRSPSPRILSGKEEKHKQVGMKSRLLKDLELMESEQISDEEAEIAGVLFSLSRSFVPSTNTSSEKSRRGLEVEEFNSSNSQIAGLESLSKAPVPLSYEQKSKRRRVFEQKEEISCVKSAQTVTTNAACCVNELHKPASVTESLQADESECIRSAVTELFCKQPELMAGDTVKEPCHEDPEFNVAEENNTNYTEERSQDSKASEDHQRHFARIWNQGSLGLSSLSINKSELHGQVLGKGGKCSKISSRSHKGSEGSAISSSQDKRSLPENCIGKVNSEKVNQGNVGGISVKDEHRLDTDDVSTWNQDPRREILSTGKGEQKDLRLLDIKNENKAVPDLCNGREPLSEVSSLSTVHPSPSSATTVLGWMGAFPQLGLSKKAGPSWLTNCLHSGSSLNQAMQLPHAANAQQSAQKMRRCATHVRLAHFIQQQQQFLRRPFWPPSCDPHNLNLSPMNQQGKEHWSNKIPFLQAECMHTWAESTGTRMPNSRSTVSGTKNENYLAGYNKSAHVLSAGAGIKKGCKNMMTAAQIKQSTLHSSGPSTIGPSLDGSPAQNASIFNNGLYSAHVPSQNLAQQPSGLSKCQQGNRASLHVGSSHSHSTLPQAQQLQQQVQCEQLKQQCLRLTMPPQLYGAGSGAFLEGNRLGFR